MSGKAASIPWYLIPWRSASRKAEPADAAAADMYSGRVITWEQGRTTSSSASSPPATARETVLWLTGSNQRSDSTRSPSSNSLAGSGWAGLYTSTIPPRTEKSPVSAVEGSLA
jgi:hypothetical protein